MSKTCVLPDDYCATKLASFLQSPPPTPRKRRRAAETNAKSIQLLVVSARTPETSGTFNSAFDATAYDEHLLYTQRAHFEILAEDETGGRGKADTRGAQLGGRAANNKRDQCAMLE